MEKLCTTIQKQLCPLVWVTLFGIEVECEHRALNAESVIHHVMGLQILDGMDMWKVDIDQTLKILRRKLTYEMKRYRIQMKAVWLAEQQEQKQWTKQQQLLHSFGNQELIPDSKEADPVVSDAALYALIDVECSADTDDQKDLYPAPPESKLSLLRLSAPLEIRW